MQWLFAAPIKVSTNVITMLKEIYNRRNICPIRYVVNSVSTWITGTTQPAWRLGFNYWISHLPGLIKTSCWLANPAAIAHISELPAKREALCMRCCNRVLLRAP
jgi:hypothetical protein